MTEETPTPTSPTDLRSEILALWAESSGEAMSYYCPQIFNGEGSPTGADDWNWDGSFTEGEYKNVDPGALIDETPDIADGTPVDVATVELADGVKWRGEVLSSDEGVCIALAARSRD